MIMIIKRNISDYYYIDIYLEMSYNCNLSNHTGKTSSKGNRLIRSYRNRLVSDPFKQKSFFF